MTQAIFRVATATAGSAIAVIALIGAKAATGTDAAAEPTVAASPSPSAAPVPANPSATPQSPTGDGIFTGDTSSTRYGPVQVEITVTGRSISDIRVIQCPTASRRDQMICQQALPYLVNQSLAAQSANVDAVSGATFTSDGYKQSLQSAIDKAGL